MPPSFEAVNHFGRSLRNRSTKPAARHAQDEFTDTSRMLVTSSSRTTWSAAPKNRVPVEAEQGDIVVARLTGEGQPLGEHCLTGRALWRVKNAATADTDAHRDDQVERDGDDCRDDEHRSIGPGVIRRRCARWREKPSGWP
jgi:hypothetical protein